MRHNDDGTLRRMYDEPLALSTSQRQHYTACPECRSRFEEIAEDVRRSAAWLALPQPEVDSGLALARMRRHIAAGEIKRSPGWRTRLSGLRPRGAQLTRPLGAVVAAVALLGALTLTPAGSLAQSFITIFQPTQVAVVPVTSSDLQNLPNLTKYGTVHAPAKVHDQPVKSAAAAATLSGMQVLAPSTLPAGVPATVRYDVVPSSTGTFTFDAAKAQREAATEGRSLPPMPARIDGSTLQITIGTAVVATYGSKTGQVPTLAIGEMKAPRVASSGVSVKEIEDYVLNLPGVSPQLRQAIQAIGDPSTTLPIPVPIDLAHAQAVKVQGVQGLALGDSTGVGSAVLWQKNGVMYGVGGTLPLDQIESIAGSLR
jgi:hypothetical protein